MCGLRSSRPAGTGSLRQAGRGSHGPERDPGDDCRRPAGRRVGDERGVRGAARTRAGAVLDGPALPALFFAVRFAADPDGCFVAVCEQDPARVAGALSLAGGCHAGGRAPVAAPGGDRRPGRRVRRGLLAVLVTGRAGDRGRFGDQQVFHPAAQHGADDIQVRQLDAGRGT